MQNIQGNMDVTNDYYGGKTPEDVTRIVYVNGSIDPWHRMGIYEADLNEDAPAIYIQGSAHCADMYEESSITSPELEEARAQIRELVATWIAEFYAWLSFLKNTRIWAYGKHIHWVNLLYFRPIVL